MLATVLHRISCVLLSVAVLTLIAPRTAFGQSASLTEIDAIDFQGNETFTVEEIRSELASDVSMLLASHPSTSQDEYLQTLCERLVEGYRHVGFPNAQAATRLDSRQGRIVVDVVEGPRVICGGVRVVGARRMSAEAIAAAFLARDKSGDPSHWQTGEPAPFDETRRQYLIADAVKAFESLGHYSVRFEVYLQPNADDSIADAVVEIADEGPPAVLSKALISGLQKNSRESVDRYLDLTPGRLIDRVFVNEVKQRLEACGRFCEIEVEALKPIGDRERITLNIKVTETVEAPPLDQELSEIEQILLKCREWTLARFRSGDVDLVIESSINLDDGRRLGIRGILHGSRGGLLWFDMQSQSQIGKPLMAVALVANEGRLYEVGGRRKCCLHFERGAKLEIGILGAANGGPDDQLGSVSTSLYGTLSSSRDGEALAAVEFGIAPAACVSLAHREHANYRLEHGQLRIEEDGLLMCVDSNSGAFLELAMQSHFGPLSVRFETGAFDRELAELDALSADWPNAFDPRHSLGSVFAFLIHAAARLRGANETIDPASLAAWEQFLRGRAIPIVDSIFQSSSSDKDDDFIIPPSLEELGAIGQTGAFAAIFAAPIHHAAQPDTWPKVLARQVVFVTSGKTDLLGADLQAIFDSHDTGPIGCWATAYLLAYVEGRYARQFAERGLERLSVEDFRRDYRLVLENPTPAIQDTLAQVAGLAELSDTEVELLGGLLEPADRAAFVRLARELRAAGPGGRNEAISHWLDSIWESRLRAIVETDLKRLASGE